MSGWKSPHKSEDGSLMEPPVKVSLVKMALKNPIVLRTVSFASLAGILFGYDQGVVSGIITQESFGARFPRIYSDSDYKGWFVSTFLLCAWFGSLLNAPIVDYFGRKKSMTYACCVFVIGSVFQCAGHSISMLFGGRAVAGVAVGMLTMVAPLYMAEISPPAIRGGLVALQQLSITFGILISYWIDYGTNHIGGTKCAPGENYMSGVFNPYIDVPAGGCYGQSDASWRVPFGLQIFPAFVLGVGMLVMPYSPRWLLAQGRDQEALQTLVYLRKLEEFDPELQTEYLEIKAEVMFEQDYKKQKFGDKTGIALFWAEYVNILTVKSHFKRVFIGSAIMFFQQFMGCNAMIYYAPTIFASLGLSSNSSSLLATGVYGIVNFVCTIPAVLLLDKLGRRTLLMAGAIGTCISLVIVGGIVGKYHGDLSANKSAGWVGVAFIYIYDVNFSYSWSVIGWLIPSEIFPLSIRSKAISITTSSTWMNNFIIGLVTPKMLDTMQWGTYIFFAAFCLIALLFTVFVVPETKGRSLEEMDAVFGDKAAEEKHHLVEIMADLKKQDVSTKSQEEEQREFA